MAKNLQSKLGPGDKVSIFDINPEAMKTLEAETKAAPGGAAVELAASAFDAAKEAVSSPALLGSFFRFRSFACLNDAATLFYL